MSAYYNEFDPKKAAWLRELIKRGLIAPGDVDERSIQEARIMRLRGYGDGIVAQVAENFIRAYMQVEQQRRANKNK